MLKFWCRSIVIATWIFVSLTPAFADSTPDSKTLLGKADQLFMSKTYSEALSTYQQFLQSYPNDSQTAYAVFRCGVTMMRLNDYPGAIKQFRKILSDYPTSSCFADAESGLANSCVAIGKTCEGVLANTREFDSPRLRRLIARSFRQKADATSAEAVKKVNLGEALKIYQSYLKDFPGDPGVFEVTMYTGDMARQLKNDEEAFKIYNHLIETDPTHPLMKWIIPNTALVCKSRKDTESSIKAFDGLAAKLSALPVSPFMLYLSGEVYRGKASLDCMTPQDRKDNFQKAIDYYNRILREYTHDAIAEDAMFRIEFCYASSGNYDAAVKQCKLIIQVYPESNTAKSIKAILPMMMVEAEKTYQGLLTHFPDEMATPLQRLQVAWCLRNAANDSKVKLVREDLLAEAVKIYQSVISGFPKDKCIPEAVKALADTMILQGNYNTAITTYKYFLKTYPNDIQSVAASKSLADAYRKNGNLDFAAQTLEAAVTHFPNDPHAAAFEYEVGRTYRDLYYKAEDSKAKQALGIKAELALKKAVDLAPNDLGVAPRADLIRINLLFDKAKSGQIGWQQVESRIQYAIDTYKLLPPERISEFYFCFVDAYMAQQKWDEVISRCDSIIAQFPKCSAVVNSSHHRAGIAFEMLSKNDQALKHYITLINTNTEVSNSWELMIQRLIQQGRAGEVNTLLQTMLNSGLDDSTVAKVHIYLVQVGGK